MDHVTSRQPVAGGDLGPADLAAAQLGALGQQTRPRRLVYRAVHAAPAQQRRLGGIDDRIDVYPGDVAGDMLHHRRGQARTGSGVQRAAGRRHDGPAILRRRGSRAADRPAASGRASRNRPRHLIVQQAQPTLLLPRQRLPEHARDSRGHGAAVPGLELRNQPDHGCFLHRRRCARAFQPGPGVAQLPAIVLAPLVLQRAAGQASQQVRHVAVDSAALPLVAQRHPTRGAHRQPARQRRQRRPDGTQELAHAAQPGARSGRIGWGVLHIAELAERRGSRAQDALGLPLLLLQR